MSACGVLGILYLLGAAAVMVWLISIGNAEGKAMAVFSGVAAALWPIFIVGLFVILSVQAHRRRRLGTPA